MHNSTMRGAEDPQWILHLERAIRAVDELHNRTTEPRLHYTVRPYLVVLEGGWPGHFQRNGSRQQQIEQLFVFQALYGGPTDGNQPVVHPNAVRPGPTALGHRNDHPLQEPETHPHVRGAVERDRIREQIPGRGRAWIVDVQLGIRHLRMGGGRGRGVTTTRVGGEDCGSGVRCGCSLRYWGGSCRSC